MNEVEFDALITELRNEADEAAWHIGFMKVAIDQNEMIADRLNGSCSGYAGLVARSAVKAAVILYCARAWDKARDSVSLRRAFEEFPALDDLNTRRSEQLATLGIEFDEATLVGRYANLLEEYSVAEASPEHHHIRLLRTEYFAHRVIESDDRKKLAKAGVDVDPATYDGLLRLAVTTVSLVGEFGYLWDRLSNPYPDRIAYAERCCREFWRNVPVLRDVEEWEDQVMTGSAMPDEPP
ncbi:hypothetical protein [Rhodobacter sp. CZR27]|uniref:AbiU2 domain-containing protein n=1 Tax=Rhodobacter sp. CZR27 TaxID=2033869 RepID=UPI0012FDD3C6|nr:hypothetical protein [Rhodobacter sp. CZR27]